MSDGFGLPAPGRIHAIHVSPARGLPMRPVESVLLASGRGIPGDRYHQSRHRHVSVQALEDLEADAAEAEEAEAEAEETTSEAES